MSISSLTPVLAEVWSNLDRIIGVLECGIKKVNTFNKDNDIFEDKFVKKYSFLEKQKIYLDNFLFKRIEWTIVLYKKNTFIYNGSPKMFL